MYCRIRFLPLSPPGLVALLGVAVWFAFTSPLHAESALETASNIAADLTVSDATPPAPSLSSAAKVHPENSPETVEVVRVSHQNASCEAWHLPDGYDDSWVPESFKTPCSQHRVCYGAEDASWARCNSDFYAALRQACDGMYPHAVLSAGSDNSEQSASSALLACLQVADDFFAKVQTASGLKQFQRFQSGEQKTARE